MELFNQHRTGKSGQIRMVPISGESYAYEEGYNRLKCTVKNNKNFSANLIRTQLTEGIGVRRGNSGRGTSERHV